MRTNKIENLYECERNRLAQDLNSAPQSHFCAHNHYYTIRTFTRELILDLKIQEEIFQI